MEQSSQIVLHGMMGMTQRACMIKSHSISLVGIMMVFNVVMTGVRNVHFTLVLQWIKQQMLIRDTGNTAGNTVRNVMMRIEKTVQAPVNDTTAEKKPTQDDRNRFLSFLNVRHNGSILASSLWVFNPQSKAQYKNPLGVALYIPPDSQRIPKDITVSAVAR